MDDRGINPLLRSSRRKADSTGEAARLRQGLRRGMQRDAGANAQWPCHALPVGHPKPRFGGQECPPSVNLGAHKGRPYGLAGWKPAVPGTRIQHRVYPVHPC